MPLVAEDEPVLDVEAEPCAALPEVLLDDVLERDSVALGRGCDVRGLVGFEVPRAASRALRFFFLFAKYERQRFDF